MSGSPDTAAPDREKPRSRFRRLGYTHLGALKLGGNAWPGVPGGRVWVGKNGTLHFRVVRKIAGVRYSVNLHAHDPESAIYRLREFERNPAGFNPHGSPPPAPVLLTPELIGSYVKWCALPAPGRTRSRNTDANWIAQKRNILCWWMERVAGRSLRSDGTRGCLTTDDIKAVLSGTSPGTYRNRLVALKGLYSYLGTDADATSRVSVEHNPVRPLRVPQFDPAQAQPGGSKVAWTKEDAESVIGWLEQQGFVQRRRDAKKFLDVRQAAAYLRLTPSTVRAYAERGRLRHQGGGHGNPLVFRREDLDRYDRKRAADGRIARRVALALRVLGGTGWHVREVVRFSTAGSIEELPPDHVRENGAAKVLITTHKSGFRHATAVTQLVADAAAELQRLGGIEVDPIYKWTRMAVAATKVHSFKPGQFRHATGTYQINRGVPRVEVSERLGHKNPSTTLIYTMLAVPTKKPTWF